MCIDNDGLLFSWRERCLILGMAKKAEIGKNPENDFDK
jgi:hypothetical protein